MDKKSLFPFVIFLTGASGAGKTTLVKHLSHQHPDPSVAYLNFDSIGVPSEEEMNEKYGSGSEWQRAMTKLWVKTILTEYNDKQSVIIEGQINLSFIVEAFRNENFSRYKIVLIHCDDSIRHKRLHIERNQSELINQSMDNWSAFLRKQGVCKFNCVNGYSLQK